MIHTGGLLRRAVSMVVQLETYGFEARFWPTSGLPTIRDFMAITALSVLIVKKWAQIPIYFVIDSFGTTIPPGKGFAHAC
jgi:hypothetical protein